MTPSRQLFSPQPSRCHVMMQGSHSNAASQKAVECSSESIEQYNDQPSQRWHLRVASAQGGCGGFRLQKHGRLNVQRRHGTQSIGINLHHAAATKRPWLSNFLYIATLHNHD